jgi:hypothetical protein
MRLRLFEITQEMLDDADRGWRQRLAQLEMGGSALLYQQHTPAKPGQRDRRCRPGRATADNNDVPRDLIRVKQSR